LDFLISNYYPELSDYEFEIRVYDGDCPRIQKLSGKRARFYLNLSYLSRSDDAFIGTLAHELSHITTDSLQEEVVDYDVVRRRLGHYLAMARPLHSLSASPFGGRGYYLGRDEISRLQNGLF
jgi:hypothetical protein